MSGVVPAKIAASFTMAELAVLTVIARQCQRSGTCTLHIDAIAALAGCSRTSVQNALRQARLPRGGNYRPYIRPRGSRGGLFG